MHIFFTQITVKPLFSHLHKAGFLAIRVMCKLVTCLQITEDDMKGYINSKNGTFFEIKYMNRLDFFSKAMYMIWVGFKILTRTPELTLPRDDI